MPRTLRLRSRGPHHGFTLLELMVVVVVVSILAAVALPSYNAYVQRAHRGHAKSALMQLAQWMERAATVTGSYPASGDVPSGLRQVEGGRYTITVTSAGTTFSLTAAPQGVQSGDACGSFVLDQANRQMLSGQSDSATAEACWQR